MTHTKSALVVHDAYYNWRNKRYKDVFVVADDDEIVFRVGRHEISFRRDTDWQEIMDYLRGSGAGESTKPATDERAIDWERVPSAYQWVAVDEDGRTYAYVQEPYIDEDEGVWQPNNDDDVWPLRLSKYAVPKNTSWRTSLRRRPE